MPLPLGQVARLGGPMAKRQSANTTFHKDYLNSIARGLGLAEGSHEFVCKIADTLASPCAWLHRYAARQFFLSTCI
jgi:hypothetical protein